MRKPRNGLPILAFTASLLTHAGLLITLPMAIEATTVRDQGMNRSQQIDEVVMLPPLPPEPEVAVVPPPPPPPPPPEEAKDKEVEVGIDAPTPASKTWLGYREEQPQLAEKNVVQQAAFVDEPVAAAPPMEEQQPEETVKAEEQPEPSPAQEPQPEMEASPAREESKPSVAQPAQEQLPPSPVEEVIGEKKPGEEPGPMEEPMVEKIESPEMQKLTEAIKEIWEKIQKALEDSAQTTPETPEAIAAEASPAQPQSKAQLEAKAAAEKKERLAPQPQDAPREVGDPSDKESSPTSLIDVPPEQWQLGKPLARQGLQLKPRRPEITLLTMLTTAAGNPLCQIDFGKDGVPVDAKLLRSSGDRRVDDAILASLFRWRAEGEQLKQVKDGKTLNVLIRVILNRRALMGEDEEKSG